MNRSKTNISKASINQRSQRGQQIMPTSHRSDYHNKHQSVSSDEDTDGLLVYEWSKVITIYNPKEQEFAVFKAEIDTDHMKTETKGPVGRPLQNWDFIFSPDKFDREIGLEQFNGECLPLEEMQHQGIKASLVRQDLIERAQKVVETFQFDAGNNQLYQDKL